MSRRPAANPAAGSKRHVLAMLSVAVCLSAWWGSPVQAADAPAEPPAAGALLPRDSADAAIFRGGLVYANYCVTCHGMNADGNGRAARLYTPRPANLRSSDKNDAYFELIIRKGGASLSRSEFMPTWEAELTDEQIHDLVAYLRSINVNK
jgi:mono/diheme cytochrome c family protein